MVCLPTRPVPRAATRPSRIPISQSIVSASVTTVPLTMTVSNMLSGPTRTDDEVGGGIDQVGLLHVWIELDRLARMRLDLRIKARAAIDAIGLEIDQGFLAERLQHVDGCGQ